MKRKLQHIAWPVITVLIATMMTVLLQAREEQDTVEALTIPEVDYWRVFANISKERKYFEEFQAHYRVPVFSPELISLSGKEITLTGFYLPHSKWDSVIVISRYPNSSCFFCGQAGIESVAMVELGDSNMKTYRVDQMLLVRGKLMLNSTDLNKLAFVLTEATVKELRL